MALSVSAEVAHQGGYVSGLRTGAIEARLDIDEFVLDRDVLNLFLLALREIQDRPSDNPWSWFQIAGIHGRPFGDWDHAGAKPVETNSETRQRFGAGYCSHSSVTFPTWHRPYVAMMEQAVYVEMIAIAKRFTDPVLQQNYLNACSRFRFPYWDPCLPRTTLSQAGWDDRTTGGRRPNDYEYGIPLIVSKPTVFVRKPSDPSLLVPLPNPLYEFSFPEEARKVDNPDFSWRESNNVLFNSLGGNERTVRAPNAEGKTDDAYVNDYISRHIQSDIGSSLYKVLNFKQPWATFSNDVYDRSGDQDGQGNHIFHSVEGFHDNIHGFLGQGRLQGASGHMGDPQYAAFDPIFWLHHCNIDRIIALWQAKLGPHDPRSWWQQQKAFESNWAVPRNSDQRPSDDLIPFRKSKRVGDHETFWTSNDVQDWTHLGYTYLGRRVVPGANGQNELDTFPLDFRNTNQNYLNTFSGQFYGWMDNAGPGSPALVKQFFPIDLSDIEALTGEPGPERPPIKSHPSRIPSNRAPDSTKPDYSHLRGLLTRSGMLRQWNIQIQAEKFKFQGSYQIFIFLGEFPPDFNQWPSATNLVGIDVIFSTNPDSGGCSNCETQAEGKLVITDVIPLTAHLIKWIRSGERVPAEDPNGIACRGLEYDDVYPFLRKNLHWRVTDMHLNRPVQEVEGITLCAVDQEVYLPKTYEEPPVFGEYNVHGPTSGSYPGENRPAYDAPQQEYGETTENEKKKHRWGCGICAVM